MRVEVFHTKQEMGREAAEFASGVIHEAIQQKGEASLVLATGASQLEFLDALVRQPVNWSKVVFFHLDEYLDLPETHPASIRRYLKERVAGGIRPGEFHFVEGDTPDPGSECRRLGELISCYSIDLACVGIGENGHLAFNDPPADFATEEPFLVVELDEACRRQQLGEGWFRSLEEVPRKAISMSIRQILRSNRVLCVVPDRRKAPAVKNCLEEDISPWCPASILRDHAGTVLMLDEDSASLLSATTRERYGIRS